MDEPHPRALDRGADARQLARPQPVVPTTIGTPSAAIRSTSPAAAARRSRPPTSTAGEAGRRRGDLGVAAAGQPEGDGEAVLGAPARSTRRPIRP